jgi:hypothetical protein
LTRVKVYIIAETRVPVVTQSGIAHSFSARVDFAGQGLVLQLGIAGVHQGWSLGVSTERGDTFNVIAEGLDWAYPA